MQALGAVIQRRRELRGWTSYRLAEKAEVSTAYLRAIELGRGKRVGVRVLAALAHALGMSTDELLTEAGVITGDDEAGMSREETGQHVEIMLRRSGKLSEKDIEHVKSYVEWLEDQHEREARGEVEPPPKLDI